MAAEAVMAASRSHRTRVDASSASAASRRKRLFFSPCARKRSSARMLASVAGMVWAERVSSRQGWSVGPRLPSAPRATRVQTGASASGSWAAWKRVPARHWFSRTARPWSPRTQTAPRAMTAAGSRARRRRAARERSSGDQAGASPNPAAKVNAAIAGGRLNTMSPWRGFTSAEGKPTSSTHWNRNWKTLSADWKSRLAHAPKQAPARAALHQDRVPERGSQESSPPAQPQEERTSQHTAPPAAAPSRAAGLKPPPLRKSCPPTAVSPSQNAPPETITAVQASRGRGSTEKGNSRRPGLIQRAVRTQERMKAPVSSGQLREPKNSRHR